MSKFNMKDYFQQIKKTVFILSVTANIVCMFIFFTPFTEQLYKPLIVDEPYEKSEVIVILSAGVYESGTLGFKTMVRIEKGIRLYRNNIASQIICAGGISVKKTNTTIARAMKELLILFGVPDEDILVQDETINTYRDISGIIDKYSDKYDFSKAIFVTSSYHTYRVKKILKKKKIDATVVSAHAWELKPKKWSERADLFREILREYAAICYFGMKGWI